MENLVEKLKETRAEILSAYRDSEHPGIPWIVAFSGGKDSSLMLHLVLEEVAKLPASERKREIFVVSNDTLVESPLVVQHMYESLKKVDSAAIRLGLPIQTHVTKPPYWESFWVNLIGKGYPTPNRQFRWCTDRLKIGPTSNFIQRQVDRNGTAIILLGTRSAESATRAKSIKRHRLEDSRYGVHTSLQNCMTYSPIASLTDDEVWVTLLQFKPPWGGSYKELITLYKNAKGGECPTVLSKEEAPSCGGTSARFGCWVCTVVNKDRSLEGLIDSGYDEFQDLADFRDWLLNLRDVAENRLPVNRKGSVRYRKDGTIIPGPFTMKTREKILDRLTMLEKRIDKETHQP